MPLAPAPAACCASSRSDWPVESCAGDNRYRALHFFHRRAHDGEMFGGGERVELARAARGDDRGRGMREHRAQVAPVAIQVERQIGFERGHGEPDDALQLRPQFIW